MSPFIQLVRNEHRLRSRYLLPMEMLLSGVLLLSGLSGGLAHGYLWQQLHERGENASWLLGVGGVGLAGVIVCAWEWFAGVPWNGERQSGWIAARGWIALLGAVMWLYILYVLTDLPKSGIVTMVGLAFFLTPFHVWAWWVNYRCWYVLNPRFHTRKLEARLEATRSRW